MVMRTFSDAWKSPDAAKTKNVAKFMLSVVFLNFDTQKGYYIMIWSAVSFFDADDIVFGFLFLWKNFDGVDGDDVFFVFCHQK